MSLTYLDLERLLSISPRWTGFEGCTFNLQVWSLDEAVDRLVTCWDKVNTFEVFAANQEANPKVQGLVADFDFRFPVLTVAFRRDVLHRLWAAAYPVPGDDLVVIDGNHRLLALAIRRRSSHPDGPAVGVFVCS